WQLVVMKSAGSAHGCGAAVDGVVAGGAFVGMSSAAHASAAYEPPTAARRTAQIVSFAMRKLLTIRTTLMRQACSLAACAATACLTLRRGLCKKIFACGSIATRRRAVP